MRFLFIDLDLPQTRALSRSKSIFLLRFGIYNLIELISLAHKSAEFYFLHPDKTYEKEISKMHGFIAYQSTQGKDINVFSWQENLSQKNKDIENLRMSYTDIFLSSSFEPSLVLNKIEPRIKKDIPLWCKANARFLISNFSKRKFCIEGKRQSLYIHKKAKISSGVIFDTRSGPIVIDKDVQVKAFSHLCGPLYIAPMAQLINARLSGGTIIGKNTRVGGEIQNSIFGDFSNKYHEGFIGHSIIGNWVNLGAASTNSDLKNNYGEIRIELPQERTSSSNLLAYSTGRKKFGVIIGDNVKTAIGTMLNCGTVIDFACNVFGGNVPKYLPPFSWGANPKAMAYELKRFIKDSEYSATRRQQKLNDAFYRIVEDLYEKLLSDCYRC